MTRIISFYRKPSPHLRPAIVLTEILRLAVCVAFIAGLFAIYAQILKGGV